MVHHYRKVPPSLMAWGVEVGAMGAESGLWYGCPLSTTEHHQTKAPSPSSLQLVPETLFPPLPPHANRFVTSLSPNSLVNHR